MDERLGKYYDGRRVDDDSERISAVAAFAALLEGRMREGHLFLMHSDEFMEKNLLPEDFALWMEEKGRFLSQQ